MTTAFQLRVNGNDHTPPGADVDDSAEWDVNWEERIDGVGRAGGTIQSRNNDLEFGKERDEIEMLVNGDRVFHGEITGSRVDLPPGRQFPKWKFTAADSNTIPDLRLVGCPDGSDFHSIDGGQTHSPLDPHAHCRATDRLTVEWLFEKYAQMPNGDPIDATTFVRHYINKFVLYNKLDKPVLWWTHSTLRQALDELANMAGFPIFYWMDPDDKFHWVNFANFASGLGALPRLMPRGSAMSEAPARITDVTADLDGATVIGGRDLYFEYDANFMPEQVYVTGATDHLSADGVTTTYQGTGFRGRLAQDISKRQILVETQALTEAQKDATARSYEQYNTRARVKGSVTVGQPGEAVDGWRCGQRLLITDARLPATLNGKRFPIQRVAGSLKAGNDFRVYTLEFGDAPIGRFGQRYKAATQRIPKKRLPASEHVIKFPTVHLRPDSEYELTSQMVDTSGSPFRQAGVSVEWSLVMLNRLGAVVTGGGTIAPNGSIVQFLPPLFFLDTMTNVTDVHGRTGAKLTTGPLTDLYYHVRAVTVPQYAEPDLPGT